MVKRVLSLVNIFMFCIQLAGLSLVLQACATTAQYTGKPIEPSLVQRIRKGETTSEEIISMFGAPTTTSRLGEHELFVYKYCLVKGKGLHLGYVAKGKAEELCDELTVTLDKNGKVAAYNFVKRIEE